jgi:hypothetical protein
VTDTNHLKLIEINTNASFLALGFEMYQMRKFSLPVPDFTMDEIKKNIQTELALQKKSSNSVKVAIVDEEPSKQRLFVEFLLYQAYFESWKWPTQILDYREPISADFIYNRWTDFYLQEETSKNLRKKFLDRSACVSPNPYEYFLLADKQRMIDWWDESFWGKIPDLTYLKSKIQQNLPITKNLDPTNAKELWAHKKNYFMKPKRAFGAKQSYKGASMTHKVFGEILNQDFIAQEFVPAPERAFPTPSGLQNFKFDLRFYVYQDRVQLVLARIYQGQVTNLRTELGGFAPVRFI